MEQKNLPSPLHHHQIKSKFRMASFRSPKAAHCSDFVALIELFSVFLFSLSLFFFSTLLLWWQSPFWYSLLKLLEQIHFLQRRAQQFNTRRNSKAKVSWVLCLSWPTSFTAHEKGQLCKFPYMFKDKSHVTLLMFPSSLLPQKPRNMYVILNFVHHLESMHQHRRFPRV